MKIAIISSVFANPWGGSEELWYQTGLKLLELGHEVMASLFEVETKCSQHENFINKGGIIQFRKKFKNGRLHVLKHSFFSAFTNVFNWKPDVIILSLGCMTDLGLYPDLKRHLKNGSYKVIMITLFNADNIIPDTYTRNLLRSFCSKTNHFVFVSHHNYALAERQLAMKLQNVEVFSSPVSYLDSYDKLSWPDNTDCIKMACVARLDIANKGQDILLEALAGNSWKQRNWKLTIYGNGRDKEYIEQLIKYYGLADKVTFGGYVSDTREIWKTHHWMVMASRSEGLSLALLEGMICGRVCIVTDVGGHGEVVTDSVSGFLAEAPRAKYFSAALERAWIMQQEYQTIATNAHKAAAELFRQNPVQKMLNIISN